jgi:hypothetical protein
MKVIRNIVVLFLLFAACASAARSEECPQELSMFYSTPEVVKPGAVTTFTFIFNVAMDVSENPRLFFKMSDNNVLSFQVRWVDDFSCVLAHSFTSGVLDETAEITLAGARTIDNKEVGDIHGVVQFIREQQKTYEVVSAPDLLSPAVAGR